MHVLFFVFECLTICLYMHYLVALPKVLSCDSIIMYVYYVKRMIYHENLIDDNFFIALRRKIIASIRFSMLGHNNVACYQVVSPYSTRYIGQSSFESLGIPNFKCR